MSSGTVVGERWTNRALISLLWPIVVEQILAVTMGAVDTIMVNSVGEYAVSAVSIIDNINNLLIIAFIALCTGGTVVVSQYIGRGDNKNSRLAAKQLVYITTLISFIIMTITILFRRPLIRLIYGRLEDDVLEAAIVYLFITGLSYPFLAVNNANAALFRAAGNSRIPMRIALLANVLNVGGNVFFIFVMNYGVMGAALSTLLCRITAAFITTIMLYRGSYGPVSLSGLFDVKFSRPMIRDILNVGIPSGVENSMFQLGRLMTQRIFTYFGTAAIAANAIASVINSYSFMPGMAFGLALLTVAGQCVGAGDYEGVIKQTYRIMKLAYITLIIISAAVLLCQEPLLGLFKLSAEAHAMAKTYLRVHCVSLALGWAMSFVLPNALRATGDARYVMITASITMWTIRVSSAYLLTFTFGIGPLGVWLAMAADFFARSVIYYVRWKSGKWRGKRVISA